MIPESLKSYLVMDSPGEWIAAAKSALTGAVASLAASSEVDLPMRFWKDENPIDLTREALAASFPQPARKICILVHGLCCNERFWRFPGDKNTSYGSLLEAEMGYMPFFLRYNTGRHISDNGKNLSELIETLLDRYPLELEEIILIGHSMGGMVIRSACYYGEISKHAWVDRVRHVFFLASPHLGAPLEKLGNLATAILRTLPSRYARLTGEIINLRSNGIKDLRFGYLVDEDWCGTEPDSLLNNHRNNIDLLPRADHYVVAGTLTKDPAHPVTTLLGDVLVRLSSAKGIACKEEDSIPFSRKNYRIFRGLNHLILAHHPQVYQQIRSWLMAAT